MKDAVRLSFDISAAEHATLKSACAEARISMKDFLRRLVVSGIKDLKEDLINKSQAHKEEETENNVKTN